MISNPYAYPALGGAHLDAPDAYTWMPDVWEYLEKKYSIRSMIDVGCGAGFSTAWWHARGCYAIGIEGWPEAIAKTRMPMQRMILHDYTHGPLAPKPIDSDLFDLAWSAEFLEHVEEQFIPNFMATFQQASYVCVTHGVPGQDGWHHVNCQTTEYWINKFKEFGFYFDAIETDYLRHTGTGKEPWGRPTLCWFVRK